MPIPLHRRGFDAFLSHAHVDKAFVNQLYDWLTRVAGLQIWYDSKEMTAGTAIATGLHDGIEDCRGLIVVGSEAAFSSGWVRKEINVAQDEQARNSDFRLVPIILGETSPDSELRGVSWIKAPAPELTFQLAIEILRAINPAFGVPNPRSSRDVYISASWHEDDRQSAVAVCRQLGSEGFRLVGDSKNQEGFSTNRIEEIIGSCGALVCIIPFRGEADISAESGPYRYFIREISKALDLNMPVRVFVDPKLRGCSGFRSEWVEMDSSEPKLNADHLRAARSLHDLWQPPPLPHYVFLATDLDSKVANYNSDLRRLIESITGMPTVVGPDIEGENLPRRIIDSITRSFLVIADISGTGERDFNLDVSIEAGIAFATKRNIRLIARGDPRRPPFMLRSAGQLRTYTTEAEYCGLIRNICWPFRRRIINRELT